MTQMTRYIVIAIFQLTIGIKMTQLDDTDDTIHCNSYMKTSDWYWDDTAIDDTDDTIHCYSYISTNDWY